MAPYFTQKRRNHVGLLPVQVVHGGNAGGGAALVVVFQSIVEMEQNVLRLVVLNAVEELNMMRIDTGVVEVRHSFEVVKRVVRIKL